MTSSCERSLCVDRVRYDAGTYKPHRCRPPKKRRRPTLISSAYCRQTDAATEASPPTLWRKQESGQVRYASALPSAISDHRIHSPPRPESSVQSTQTEGIHLLRACYCIGVGEQGVDGLGVEMPALPKATDTIIEAEIRRCFQTAPEALSGELLQASPERRAPEGKPLRVAQVQDRAHQEAPCPAHLRVREELIDRRFELRSRR